MSSMRFALAVVFLFAASSFAGSAEGQDRQEGAVEPSETVTLAKLGAVQQLRCDAKRRAKAESLKTQIYTAEMNALRGPAKAGYKAKVAEAEAKAGASNEEAGALRRRLVRMAEGYISARRLDWYKQADESEKIHLEEKILLAIEIRDSGCASDRKPRPRR